MFIGYILRVDRRQRADPERLRPVDALNLGHLQYGVALPRSVWVFDLSSVVPMGQGLYDPGTDRPCTAHTRLAWPSSTTRARSLDLTDRFLVCSSGTSFPSFPVSVLRLVGVALADPLGHHSVGSDRDKRALDLVGEKPFVPVVDPV